MSVPGSLRVVGARVTRVFTQGFGRVIAEAPAPDCVFVAWVGEGCAALKSWDSLRIPVGGAFVNEVDWWGPFLLALWTGGNGHGNSALLRLAANLRAAGRTDHLGRLVRHPGHPGSQKLARWTPGRRPDTNHLAGWGSVAELLNLYLWDDALAGAVENVLCPNLPVELSFSTPVLADASVLANKLAALEPGKVLVFGLRADEARFDAGLAALQTVLRGETKREHTLIEAIEMATVEIESLRRRTETEEVRWREGWPRATSALGELAELACAEASVTSASLEALRCKLGVLIGKPDAPLNELVDELALATDTANFIQAAFDKGFVRNPDAAAHLGAIRVTLRRQGELPVETLTIVARKLRKAGLAVRERVGIGELPRFKHGAWAACLEEMPPHLSSIATLLNTHAWDAALLIFLRGWLKVGPVTANESKS